MSTAKEEEMSNAERFKKLVEESPSANQVRAGKIDKWNKLIKPVFEDIERWLKEEDVDHSRVECVQRDRELEAHTAPKITLVVSGNKVSIMPKYSDLPVKRAVTISSLEVIIFRYIGNRWIPFNKLEDGVELNKETFFESLIKAVRLG